MSCPISYELALNFHNTTYQRNEDNSCLFLSLDKFDYLQCVEQCGNLNSTMAVPQSFIEERTLKRRIWPDGGDLWWLGGYRSSLTDDFVWQDGSDFIYSNFQFGEPNNFVGTEDCLVAGATGWRDASCTLKFNCLCQSGSTLTDDFLHFGKQDIERSSSSLPGQHCVVGDFSTSLCASNTIKSYLGAVQLLLVLVFFLVKFFALTNSSILPNKDEKRDSITTTTCSPRACTWPVRVLVS